MMRLIVTSAMLVVGSAGIAAAQDASAIVTVDANTPGTVNVVVEPVQPPIVVMVPQEGPWQPQVQAPLAQVPRLEYPSAEVQNLLNQRAALRTEYRRYRLGGPIALMATGFGLSLILASFAAIAGADYGCWDCSNYGEDRVGLRLGLAALGTAVVGVGGLIWMIRRIRNRRPIREQLENVELQLRMLGVRGDAARALPAAFSF